MSFTTTVYFVFLLIGLVFYYLIPKNYRWTVLLVMSYIYYLSYRLKAVVFILFTTITVYLLGIMLERIQNGADAYLAQNKQVLSREEKKSYKNKIRHKKRIYLVIALLLNFGMLAAIKYSGFAISGVNHILRAVGTQKQFSLFTIAAPIGISFFTFQAMSYIIDIYQGKYACEKNFFKFALFVSFFPQIMQGPIGRYNRLAPTLFEGNSYSLQNIQFGIQRIGWGIFKKLIMADRAGVFVNAAFADSNQFHGMIRIIGLLMYSVQLYMDFSGGIDIVIGSAQMFGVRMDENFRQPYFSKSIGEFWRRWHITLGTWMKDYIFYPFSLSKWSNKAAKWGKKHLGDHLGKMLPICFANLLIFFIVGVWHGSEARYIVYGLYNGVIIALSNLLSPVYKKGFKVFHINSESRIWKVFQILRTFILINIGWVFDVSVSGMHSAITTLKMFIVNLDFAQVNAQTFAIIGLETRDYVIIGIGCIVVLIVSIIKEMGINVREALALKPLPVRWAVYYAFFAAIIILSYVTDNSGFMYAAF